MNKINCLLGMTVGLSSVLTLKANSTKPNFIFYITDDVSQKDIGCYGNSFVDTPNLDKMAAEGVKFTNAYVASSSCSPSRCSIITSRWPHNTGAPELHIELPKQMLTFPQLLRKNGYYTALSGKNHIGNVHRAFDLISKGKGPGRQEDWVKILKNRPKDKPFFMWFASTDAHHPFSVTPGKGKVYSPDEIIPPKYLYNGPLTRKDMAKYYHEVSRADYFMGKIRQELERQNIADNTYVIFCADNGQPFPRAKTRMFDSGSKSPLIIWSPKNLKPAVSDSLASLIDIGPTILDLANVKKTSSMMGVSLKPIFDNPKNVVRDFVFAEHNWHVNPAHERMVRFGDYLYIKNSWNFEPLGCREILPLEKEFPTAYELFKMYRKNKLKPEQMDVYMTRRPLEEIYNVKKDPNQFNNLVNSKKDLKTLEFARKVLNDWILETKDTVPGLRTRTPLRALGYRGHVGNSEKPGDATKAWLVNNPGPIFYKDIK